MDHSPLTLLKFFRLSLYPLIVVLLIPALSGCRTIRTTTTEKTAIEEALMAKATERALADLDLGTDLDNLTKRPIKVADPAGNAPNKDYVADSLRDHLLMLGFRIDPAKKNDGKAEKKEGEADAKPSEEKNEKAEDKKEEAAANELQPRIAYAAIDDIKHLIGIPSIPVPVPLVGVINTPELALFRKESQFARVKYGFYIKDPETGGLVFREPNIKGDSFYTRWTFLMFINFSTTDLPLPFGDDI